MHSAHPNTGTERGLAECEAGPALAPKGKWRGLSLQCQLVRSRFTLVNA